MRLGIRLLAILLAAGVALMGAACSFIPTTGPSAAEINEPERRADDKQDYIVVDLDQNVVAALASHSSLGLGRKFSSSGNKRDAAHQARIGVGDVLSVTIWEAGEGGLFSGGDRRSVEFQNMNVDRAGQISLPYAGVLKVSGLTPLEVQTRIVNALASRAIQPQAVVSIAKNLSNTVVLSGDIAQPGRYPLSLEGDRLLDAVAAAGGAKFPARETYVVFIRGEERGSQLLETVIESQSENVYLRAGDRVFLSHEPKKYSVFGAVKAPGVYAFGSPQVNLLEAVASTGGLLDERADATGLFVFRYEQRSLIEKLGHPLRGEFGAVVPTVYRVSLRDPGSYFYARGFMLRDKDVLYVANARGVEVAKVLRLIGMGAGVVGAARTGINGFAN
jgi:polysaccharide export outer membrane protein